jgi:hypothetical protein
VPEHWNEGWMQVRDTDLSHRILGCPQALRLNLALAPLVYFLDAGRMNAPSATSSVNVIRAVSRRTGSKQDSSTCFRRVIDHHVDTGHLLEGPDIAPLPTDDPTLHVISREMDRRDHRLRCQLRMPGAGSLRQ